MNNHAAISAAAYSAADVRGQGQEILKWIRYEQGDGNLGCILCEGEGWYKLKSQVESKLGRNMLEMENAV